MPEGVVFIIFASHLYSITLTFPLSLTLCLVSILRLTRSIRSNGYAGSQVSFGSNQGRPLTPRTPTGLSVTSPSFEYTDAPKYSELTTSRCVEPISKMS